MVANETDNFLGQHRRWFVRRSGMRKWWLAMGLAGATLGLACQAQPVAHVRWVESSTPGVKYVVVRPGFTPGHPVNKITQADGSVVNEDAEYVLMCDARGYGPMRCEIPPEVGAKASFGPSADKGPVVDAGVGVLGTKISIQHEGSPVSSSEVVAKAVPPPPDVATATAPPPPPTATTPPAPTATTTAPTGKEKKK
jgi:hypothetical protein